jgi:hypothetical protein
MAPADRSLRQIAKKTKSMDNCRHDREVGTTQSIFSSAARRHTTLGNAGNLIAATVS